MKSLITFIIIASVFIVNLNCSKSTNSISYSDYKIAFDVDGGSFTEIYTVKADGTELLRVAEAAKIQTVPYYSKPLWSPDGNYLYYQKVFGVNADVCRMDADGSNKISLTDNSSKDYLRDVSLDGKMIAFVSNRTDRLEIFVMDLTDSSFIQLTDNDFDYFGTIKFTPDGTQLVHSLSPFKGGGIYLINIADTSITEIEIDDRINYGARVSQDGRRIAYISKQEANIHTGEIYVCDFEGNNVMNFSQSYGDSHNPDWSPNNRKIAYSESSIFVVDLIIGRKYEIADESYDSYYPKWSPNGASILYVEINEGIRSLCTIEPDGTNKRIIVENVGIIGEPFWCPVR